MHYTGGGEQPNNSSYESCRWSYRSWSLSSCSRSRGSGIDNSQIHSTVCHYRPSLVQLTLSRFPLWLSYVVLILTLYHLSHLQRLLSVGKVNSEDLIWVYSLYEEKDVTVWCFHSYVVAIDSTNFPPRNRIRFFSPKFRKELHFLKSVWVVIRRWHTDQFCARQWCAEGQLCFRWSWSVFS